MDVKTGKKLLFCMGLAIVGFTLIISGSSYALLNSTNMQNTTIANNLQIQYDVSLEHLKSLDEDKLNLWNKKYKNGNYTKALDALYEFTYKKQLKETRELLNQLGVIYG